MSTQLPTGTVVFDHVSKRYQLGALGTLRETLAALRPGPANADNSRRILWALSDVSFRVEPGKSLGLIGPNGAGKTTTLKLLSNVTRPTSGRITAGGRISSLIELGAGFHPELTGRENIYLNGAILGLKRHEITRRLDAMVDFSGLERFIETPVKRYSSGMYVRLAFAVAANVEADVLLVDEVLAVGDSEFRQKCLARMDSLRQAGTTIIFVSHNMYQVRRICDQTLLLIHGQPQFLGDTSEAISTYEQTLHQSVEENRDRAPVAMSDTPGAMLISSVTVSDQHNRAVDQISSDQPLVVKASYYAPQPLIDPIVKVRLVRSDGTVCAMAASRYEPGLNWTLSGTGVITTQFMPLQLVAGRYAVEVRVIDTTDSILLTSGQSAWFNVDSPGFLHETDRGFFVPTVSWSHETLETDNLAAISNNGHGA